MQAVSFKLMLLHRTLQLLFCALLSSLKSNNSLYHEKNLKYYTKFSITKLVLCVHILFLFNIRYIHYYCDKIQIHVCDVNARVSTSFAHYYYHLFVTSGWKCSICILHYTV
jgi:hypothetical protein